MALNLYPGWETHDKLLQDSLQEGWKIYPVGTLDELVAFARAFSQMKYGG